MPKKKTVIKQRRRARPRLTHADFIGQIKAINRSQAVIEFKLDGTILHANDNFLRTMGYTLEEIQGRHHRIFVEPAVRESTQYLAFWDKLGRGEYDAGQYKRIGKDGREVWIQASYNPIMDARGRPVKIVKYATDISQQKLQAADYEGQLQAVSKARAVIEFGLDGSILKANENFLNLMGYSTEELRGQHHRMFVDPAQRVTAEYTAFWEDLRRGVFAAGAFRRVGKGGREVWMQANYNPILDLNGKPFKVVMYATDITKKKQQNELNAAFKGALDNLSSTVMVADADLNIMYMNGSMRAMLADAQADFRTELPNFDAGRLIGTRIDVFHDSTQLSAMIGSLDKNFTTQIVIGGRTLRLVFNPMLDAAGKRLGTVVEWADRTVELAVEAEIKSMVQAAGSGDLTPRVALSGKSGVFAEIAKGINQLTDNMSELVSRVQAAANEVSRGAEEISQGNTDLSQRTEQQAASLEETASSMEQMTATVKQNADNARKASQLATAAHDQADKGGAVVRHAIRAMTEINDASKKIVDIIGVIDEIAFQTNLLALNAAVEAARAGEQGRGFAVVASEVRSLAGRSATAAKEIKGLIHDSVKKVEEGSVLVTQSGHTLEHIVTAVKKVSDIIGEIAAAGQEQSAGIDQVNKAVMQLDEMTQQNTALVEQASAASQSMSGQAGALNELLDRYRVSTEVAAAVRASLPGSAERALPERAPGGASIAAERRGAQRPWKAERQPAAGGKPRVPRASVVNGDSEWDEF